MDFILKEAQSLWKQVGMKAATMGAESPAEKAQLAKIELRAELDPKVWNQIEGFVNKMLDMAVKTGNVEQTINELKTYAMAKQREFDDQEQQKAAEKDLVKDELALSPAVQAIYQAQPAAE